MFTSTSTQDFEIPSSPAALRKTNTVLKVVAATLAAGSCI
jgi:hypothetical protein